MDRPAHGGHPGTVVLTTRPEYDRHWHGECAVCSRRPCECRFGPYRPVPVPVKPLSGDGPESMGRDPWPIT